MAVSQRENNFALLWNWEPLSQTFWDLDANWNKLINQWNLNVDCYQFKGCIIK